MTAPPHLAHEWSALTDDEQREVARWFSERRALSAAERVLVGQTCTTADHEGYSAWAVGIFDDGDYMHSKVYYCRECCRHMVEAGWYQPLITLDGTSPTTAECAE